MKISYSVQFAAILYIVIIIHNILIVQLTLFLFIVCSNYFWPSIQQIESFSIYFTWISLKFGVHFSMLRYTMVIDDILGSSESTNQILTGIVTGSKFLNFFSYWFFQGSEAKFETIVNSEGCKIHYFKWSVWVSAMLKD